MNIANLFGVRRVDGMRFGLEIEAENVHVFLEDLEPPNFWNVDADGSLRNAGIELVSGVLEPEAVGPALQNAYEWLEGHGATFSSRCGTHVHVNVSHLQADKVAAVVCAYIALEPLFFRHVLGEERAENIYCIPFYEAEGATNELQHLVHTTREQPVMLRVAAGSWNKYSALNLIPLMRFGTLEFRQAPAFSVPDDLILWVNTIADFLSYCLRTYNEPGQVMDDIANEGSLHGLILGSGLVEAEDVDDAERLLNECDTIGQLLSLYHRTPSERVSIPWRDGAVVEQHWHYEDDVDDETFVQNLIQERFSVNVNTSTLTQGYYGPVNSQ